MGNFLLVASDVHSGASAFEILSDRASDPGCLAFLYAGDLEIGNYFISGKLRTRSYTFIPVRGNCDRPWSWEETGVPFPPVERSVNFGGISIWMSHGHLVCDPEETGDGHHDIVINGHTHVTSLRKSGDTVYLNPGSASRPRGRSCASYATIEFMEDVNGKRTVSISTRVLESADVIENLVVSFNK